MWQTLESITNVNQVNVSKQERLFSLVGGVILLLYAVIRIPFTAVLAFFAAIYFFFRGVRGFCYIYDQLGQNTAVQLPKERYQNEQMVPTEPSLMVETS